MKANRMRFSISSQPLVDIECDWLIVPTWEEGLSAPATELDRPLKGLLTRLRENGDLTGKANELVPILNPAGAAASRLLLVGFGKKNDLTRLIYSRAAFAATKAASGKKRRRLALAVPEPEAGIPFADMVLALGAGLGQGCHGPGIRQREPGRFEPEEIVFHLPSSRLRAETEAVVRRAESEARAVGLARDLVNEPPCDLYPESFAARAAELAREHGFECSILDEKQIEAERMGCLLAVAGGSLRPPRLVVLRYANGKRQNTLGLVGKGVTFDSGGLSLKSNEQMLDMKCDMAGAAAVLGAVSAIAELGLPVNVLGVMALVENLPGGNAVKLGDVLRSRNGKTVEVLNTDAEGRLILADALSYTIDQGASHLVDLATLTGACMVALGTDVAGLMTNDQAWADHVLTATAATGERVWQMPLFKDYGELLKSTVADLKNVGGKYGGAITAAKFLESFVGTTPWVHIDIAGPSFVSEESATKDAGGTGCFVRSLVELATRYER